MHVMKTAISKAVLRKLDLYHAALYQLHVKALLLSVIYPLFLCKCKFVDKINFKKDYLNFGKYFSFNTFLSQQIFSKARYEYLRTLKDK